MKLFVLLLLLIFLGCATGKTPPEPTKMVFFNDPSSLVFEFGSDKPCPEAKGETEEQICNNYPDGKFPTVTPTIKKFKLKPFAIDIHEVTNEQYRYCVAMGVCDPPLGDNLEVGTYSIEDYYTNEKYNDFPVVQVTWYMAKKYCEDFLGKRLPSEYEWEFAYKSGGVTKNEFPFGNKPADCIGKDIPVKYCNGEIALGPRKVASSKDDAIKISEGEILYDMIGNVMEWTSSSYCSSKTCVRKNSGECTDIDNLVCNPEDENCFVYCSTPICEMFDPDSEITENDISVPNSVKKVVRGGYFGISVEEKSGANILESTCLLHSSYRYLSFPAKDAYSFIGFRCAMDLE